MNRKISSLMSLATSILVVGSSLVGLGVGAANAASSPITVTFESDDTSGASLGGSADFGGNSSSVITSTVGSNTSKVGKIINGGECWSGTTFLIKDVGNQLISDVSKLATADVYSTTAMDVKLKVEGGAGDPAREVDVIHNGGGWQSMTFDFGAGAAVAPGNYIKASIFAGFSCGGGDHPAEVLFDNVAFPGATAPDVVVPRTTPSVLVNFESNDTSGYELISFGGADAITDTGAPAGGSVGSTTALRIKDKGECWSGTTFLKRGAKESLISSANPVVKANIYSPVAGAVIKLKLENTTGANKEVDVTSQVGWATYSFNFTGFDAAVDYSIASIFMNFTCGGGAKGDQGWGIDDIAFNGATGAALSGPVDPVDFTGNAVVRLAGVDSTNTYNRQGEADYFVGQGWYRGGLRVMTKQVPVASTQNLTYVVTNAADGSALANVKVKFVFGKAWSGSNALVSVNGVNASGADCWCGDDQGMVEGVTAGDGTVTFSISNSNVGAEAANNPGDNLGSDYTGTHLYSQVAAWVTSGLQDSIDIVDLVYYKPADAPVVKQIVARMDGLTAENSYTGDCHAGDWCKYYAEGLRYFERGLTVGSTTNFSYTVTDADGVAYANKKVKLLLGKAWSGSTAKVTVNGVSTSGGDCWCGNDQGVVEFTTDAQGKISFSLQNTNTAAEADPYQAGNLVHPTGGKHLFTQITVIGEKGNGDVLDIVDLNYYKSIDSLPPTVYNIRLADWNASNSFDGTHIWGDGGLGSWFDANTRYFAHYVKAGSTFNLRYKVTNASTGQLAPNGTAVTVHLGSGWSGSNASFTSGSTTVDGIYHNGGGNDQQTVSAVVTNGYISIPLTSTNAEIDSTENPGSATANPDSLNPLFMQVKVTADGNSITYQDWVNIVVVKSAAAAPTISSISASSGKKGQAIDIVGSNLGDALGTSVVLYTAATTKTAAVSTPVTVIAVNGDGTRMTVSSSALTQKGYFKVTNSAGTGTAGSLFSASATVTAKPAITLSSSLVKEVGATFTLTGTNLGSVSGVAIGGVSAPYSVLASNSISVTVPAGVVSGSTISATNLGGTFTTTKFVYQAAVIDSITASGRVGATVTVTGKNLKATSIVFAGNKTAKAVINNGSTLTFLVPTGALSGAIKITTGAGAVMSQSFTVVPPAPTITSFTPTTGKKGVTLVTLKGTNLLGATVTIGSTQVTVSAGATSTSLKFVIPAGAVTGKINVTTAGGNASSSANLTVTN